MLQGKWILGRPEGSKKTTDIKVVAEKMERIEQIWGEF